MSKPDKKTDTSEKLLVQNKRARFDFHISDTFEAGVVLTGAEIKSMRADGLSLQESYVGRGKGNAQELFLYGAHVKPYSHSDLPDYDPVRPKKLLLHAEEISKLISRIEAKGFTIVPLRAYLKHGRAKIEIGLAKGKNAPDKRDSVKEKESMREVARALKKA